LRAANIKRFNRNKELGFTFFKVLNASNTTLLNFTALQHSLLGWYHERKRDLPWRKTNDPYKIWLSEIILQQTKVAQGLPYYHRFLAKLPTVQSLAAAPQDEVLKLWEGLGYYSRARNMHQAAQQVCQNYGGKFPKNYQELLNLRGVGSYTAAAVASFAFKEPRAVLDGNVFRVLSRVFANAIPINTTAAKKEFQSLATEFLNRNNPALHNQAIMELGALQCTPKKPQCNTCPLKNACKAFAEGNPEIYPVKELKKYNRIRYLYYLHLTVQGQIAIQKRNENIWRGLYQFPLLEFQKALGVEQVLNSEEFKAQGLFNFELGTPLSLPPHKLSHQTLHISILPISMANKPSALSAVRWLSKKDLQNLALPKPLRQYLNQKQLNLPPYSE
jgi:A/G-specific adenine glycosylase